jgi:hypothetical protein
MPDPSPEHNDNVREPDCDSYETNQNRPLSKMVKPASILSIPGNGHDAVLQSLTKADRD